MVVTVTSPLPMHPIAAVGTVVVHSIDRTTVVQISRVNPVRATSQNRSALVSLQAAAAAVTHGKETGDGERAERSRSGGSGGGRGNRPIC
jgi:hypothetical protein